jgi:SAM-dependent methyltransferase
MSEPGITPPGDAAEVARMVEEALRLYRGGQHALAAARCRAVLAAAPADPRALQLLGLLERLLGNPEAAIVHLTTLTQHHPRIAQGHLLLGHCLADLGRAPEAAQRFRTVHDLDPGDSGAREMLANLLTRQWAEVMGVRVVGNEAMKSFAAKLHSGFIARYLSGAHILDIGFRGHSGVQQPIVPQAIGIDLDYPGYDGVRLPFADGSQDAVYSSHCLEHMTDPVGALRDWLRVLRVGGFVVAAVPHQHLYEKRARPPSSWNRHHRRFFTPASLLALFEEAWEPNSYRIRALSDNDMFYDYAVPPERHPVGCYEIDVVVEKIARPAWTLAE